MYGDSHATRCFQVGDGEANDSVYFNVSDLWLVNSTLTISQIIGGKTGDYVEFFGGISASSATFTNNASSATTETRLINKSSTNDTLTGSTFTRRYVKTPNGWRES